MTVISDARVQMLLFRCKSHCIDGNHSVIFTEGFLKPRTLNVLESTLVNEGEWDLVRDV